MEQLLIIGGYTIAVFFLGALLTYFLMVKSRQYDIRVLNNLYNSLESAQQQILSLYNLPNNVTRRGIEGTNFGSRSDEAEARIAGE